MIKDKYDEVVEKHKFNITRLGSEIDKVDTNFDLKIEKIERNLASSFNELRKSIENKNQANIAQLDKTNNTGI